MTETRIAQDVYACPSCYQPLTTSLACPQCARTYPTINGFPDFTTGALPVDIALNEQRWSDLYEHWDPLEQDAAAYAVHFQEIDAYFRTNQIGQRGPGRFLEIGCGRSYLAAEMAARGFEVLGLDVSSVALTQSREYFRTRNLAGQFARGEITHLPYRDASFVFSYGGGVLEHVRDTAQAVRELYRVTAPGGATFQTVPYASPGAILWRQPSGNIPDIPVLKQVAELVHLRLLRARHMRFGYEKSFTMSRLTHLFRNAGWGEVIVRHFDIALKFENIKSCTVHSLLTRLSRSRLCWPMVCVVARCV